MEIAEPGLFSEADSEEETLLSRPDVTIAALVRPGPKVCKQALTVSEEEEEVTLREALREPTSNVAVMSKKTFQNQHC